MPSAIRSDYSTQPVLVTPQRDSSTFAIKTAIIGAFSAKYPPASHLQLHIRHETLRLDPSNPALIPFQFLAKATAAGIAGPIALKDRQFYGVYNASNQSVTFKGEDHLKAMVGQLFELQYPLSLPGHPVIDADSFLFKGLNNGVVSFEFQASEREGLPSPARPPKALLFAATYNLRTAELHYSLVSPK